MTGAETNLGGPDAPLVACLFMNAGSQVARERGLQPMPSGLFPATTDPRIRAALALAPWNAPVFGAAGLAGVEIPMMLMVGSDDRTTPPAVMQTSSIPKSRAGRAMR